MTTTTKPATLAELRAAAGPANRSRGRSTTTSCRCSPGRRVVSRHHRLRRHRDPRDQPGPDRRARHAVSGRKGAGQEPADAAAGALSRRRDPLHRPARSAGARRSVPPDHARCASRLVADVPEDEVPIAWWPRRARYAERLAPGTKFADIIGEIDPAKLAGGTSMSAEEALHFGLIPRMHRGIFAINELPELDELVQVGLFNILEERDVQIRGYPIHFDIDVLILFSANPATYNRSGKVIPQLKDRIGSVIHTHYPRERDAGHRDHGAGGRHRAGRRVPGGGALLHAGDHRADEHRRAGSRSTSTSSRASARGSASPTTARWSPAPGSAAPCWAKSPAVPRISDLGHLYSLVAGQARARHDGQPPDVRAAGARRDHGRGHSHGVRGIRRRARTGGDRRDLLAGREDRSRRHAPFEPLRRAVEARAAGLGEGLRGERLERSRPCGPRASSSCWPGLYASDRISRSQHRGRIVYEI